MTRTIIIPENQDVSIHIPENYVGKKIEVLLYAIDEIDQDKDLNKQKSSTFRGSLNLTDYQYANFQKHTKDIRDEWNRDI